MILFLNKRPLYYRKAVVNYRVHSTNVSLGKNSEYFLKRRAEVAEALYTRSEIVEHPTLKAGMLFFISTIDFCDVPLKTVQEELQTALLGICNSRKADKLLKECWSTCDAKRDSLKIFRAVSWLTGVKMLLQIGSVAAGNRVQLMLEGASLWQKLRLMAQLGVSLALRAFISARDFSGLSLRVAGLKIGKDQAIPPLSHPN
jgi:hypothetical protein